jgi:hypothetical protein
MTKSMPERVAVLETKLDAISTHLTEQDKKLDKVLEGQQEGRTDRATIKTRLSDIEQRINKIEPDAKTIRDVKTFVRWGKWIVGGLVALAVSVLAFKGWLIANWHWLMEK